MKFPSGSAFFSRIKSKWVILGMVLLFIFIAIVVIQYASGASANRVAKNVANMRTTNPVVGAGPVGPAAYAREGFASSDTSNIEVLFFNVDWCPHCVRAKPEWAKFVDKYSGNSNITFVGDKEGVNCTNNDDSQVKDMIQKYNIEHFPTVYFVKDGQKTEYQGKVSADNLEEFMNKL
jgi:thiol-disulfide isomerase/thioredoxin